MAAPTLSTAPNATWAACVSTVFWWSGAVAAAVAVVGGLADNWRELMAMLSLGFWTNAIWLACGAMWISSVGAWFWSVLGLGFGVWPESK